VTVHIPTRTFRAGSRQRNTLAALVVALLLLFVLGAGAWALLGSSAPEQASNLVGRVADPVRSIAEPPAAPERPADGAAATNTSSSDEEPEESAGPLPPAAEAENAVFDMYVQESYQTPETSWAFLSERLQNEIGSPEEWAAQEDIYTLTYVYFPELPTAEITGDEARVAFRVRLDRETGSEFLSGTWVCVVEDGTWKLDRLEGEQTVPA
jgi:eukaryotic-like serine/threonine-protein kinase